jgi:hypothetical protein
MSQAVNHRVDGRTSSKHTYLDGTWLPRFKGGGNLGAYDLGRYVVDSRKSRIRLRRDSRDHA